MMVSWFIRFAPRNTFHSLIATQNMSAASPVVAPTAATAAGATTTAVIRSAPRWWRLSKAWHTTTSIWEPFVQDLRRGQIGSATIILRVFEHEEKVKMSDEDAQKIRDSTTADDHVEQTQNPRKIHRLELSPEPKVNDSVPVQLTPYVHDRQNHGVHENLEIEKESTDDANDPIKQPHESEISRSTIV